MTAERGFARTINLTKMDAFEVYAADMQALAADRDAERVTDSQVRSRSKDIQWRVFGGLWLQNQWARTATYVGGYTGDWASNLDTQEDGDAFR